MTLIEGVGDEVTDFFIIVVILIVGYLAWCSTRITDHLLMRTVLILQHETRSRIVSLRRNSQNSTTVSQSSNSDVQEEPAVETTPVINNNESTANCAEPSTTSNGTNIEASSEETRHIAAVDSVNSENTAAQVGQKETKESPSDSTITPACTDQQNMSTSNTNSEISIKLKFINDDQKVVTGGLKELLGDFKRRHFQLELQAQKLVRLVFNGRILQPDSQTLEKCGLFNNCVVHCLVHQPGQNPAPIQSTSRLVLHVDPQVRHEAVDLTYQRIIRPASDDEWDLGRLLVSILTLLLGLTWYSSHQYDQLFTPTTTVALYALTAMFTVALFSNLLADRDNV